MKGVWPPGVRGLQAAAGQVSHRQNGRFDGQNPDVRFSNAVLLQDQPNSDGMLSISQQNITAFHGASANFKRFRRSARGTFGAGIYFRDEKTARSYADGSVVESPDGSPRVVSVRLRFENPLQVVADYDEGEAFDLDSPAIPLLQRLFSTKAADMIAIARNDVRDGAFGEAIRKEAMRQGFDSLILTYGDQSTEYVAFHSRQVPTIGVKLLTDYDSHRRLADLAVQNSFAGVNALTASAAQHIAAEQRVRAKQNPESVRQDTAWFTGMDSQWRF